MKKLGCVISGIIVAIFVALTTTSCNKYSIYTDELSNSTWTTTLRTADGQQETLYLMFLSNHAISFGTKTKMLAGTYSYDAPNVVVNITISATESGKLGGVVTDNTMTLSDGSQQKIFTKL